MSAIFVEDSKNKKIGECSATYASIKATCPRSCPLFHSRTCYAMHGRCGLIVNRLDSGVNYRDSYKVACQEAKAIDESFKGGAIPNDGPILMLGRRLNASHGVISVLSPQSTKYPTPKERVYVGMSPLGMWLNSLMVRTNGARAVQPGYHVKPR